MSLDHIGNPSYEHSQKLVAPATPLTSENYYLKWYNIFVREKSFSPYIEGRSREFLQSEINSGKISIPGEFGFILLHLCGNGFYYLIVCTWRNGNELWETVYQCDKPEAPFTLVTSKTAHRPTFCVWELVPVWHEQRSWCRYLTSKRDPIAKKNFTEDMYTGVV